MSIASRPWSQQARNVTALVRGMHGADAAVQHGGCRALPGPRPNSADNQAVIAAQGGIGSVRTAMDGHPMRAGMQEIYLVLLGRTLWLTRGAGEAVVNGYYKKTNVYVGRPW